VFNLDRMLEDAYWCLRTLSVIELDTRHHTLMKDVYMLNINVESLYTLDASGYFSSVYDVQKYYKKYIKPLEYVILITQRLNLTQFQTRKVSNFMNLYSLTVSELSEISEQCEAEGYKLNKNLDYRVSREWLTYPDSIKKLGKDFILTDMRLKNGNNSAVGSDRKRKNAHRKQDNKRKPTK